MRQLLLYLLYTLACISLSMTAHAGEGPAGHHHDHDVKAAPKDNHQDQHSTLMEKANGAHDHGAHDHGAHSWQAPEEEKKRPNPIPSSTESITTGQQIFRHYCITCHGYEADGNTMRGQNLNPKAANLREMAGHHTDGDYHYKIRTGHGPMPHWGKTISEENIWHLVNYLQSLKPETVSNDGHHHKPASSTEKRDHHDHSSHKH